MIVTTWTASQKLSRRIGATEPKLPVHHRRWSIVGQHGGQEAHDGPRHGEQPPLEHAIHSGGVAASRARSPPASATRAATG